MSSSSSLMYSTTSGAQVAAANAYNGLPMYFVEARRGGDEDDQDCIEQKGDAAPDQKLDGWRAGLRTIHSDGLVARRPREEELGLGGSSSWRWNWAGQCISRS